MMLIGNATILTFDEEIPIIENGALLIEGKKIKEIGETEALLQKYPNAVFKNAQDKILMPGLINTHTHLYSTFARGMNLKTDIPPQNFLEILEKLWWRLDNTLNEEDIYYSALFAILDCIKNGVTTIFDHHASFNYIDGSLDIIAQAVMETGIRANLCYEVSDRHGQAKSDASLKENERFIRKIKDSENDKLGGMIGLHASFTLEDKTLNKASELADELNVPFHIHVAEGIADLQDSVKRGYIGVVDRLSKFKILRPHGLAVHGVHIKKEEIPILKESGAYVVHNPESNMGNAVGAAPIKDFFDHGILTGLGTDAYTHDMFESIKVANLLQKHQLGDPQAGWSEVYNMAFNNNVQIASNLLNLKIGKIKENFPADLIIVDYISPTPVEKDNVYSHILFGMNGGMVDTVIIDGKIIMDNREVTVLDYERIHRRTREQARRFWERF
ncbi:chlorohydrolase [Petrotoga miotherma DSM 10691]|uniref:Chlorohydrolase n=1 Tax=Petrotoga miotherma DSM 10691 TaxID=1434326 RepID=A0A2K1PEV6_9BACT|nr:putative aminohydrolase SsnA [Petrotoga miotherma]PNS01305.1 chlorohydrolase [Petrotoga miotherma DSM 10691]